MALSEKLMSVTDQEEFQHSILQSILDIFSVEACSLSLVDPNDKQVLFAITAGIGGKEIKSRQIKLAVGQGIIGWVAQNGEGVICNDPYQDPRFYSGVDKKIGFKTRSILCVPLKRQDQVIGVVQAVNTASADGFVEKDLHLLAALAGLVSQGINRIRMIAMTHNANRALQEAQDERYQWVIGQSASMQAVLDQVTAVASSPMTVLLLGESGTGKEVVARALHRLSPRVASPFVSINCTALIRELLESELFGHEKGAFTGAVAQKQGRFELANEGTLFLDEIGDMELGLQAKLLRVLQEKEFHRVGGSKEIRVNVRILAATNRDLRQAVSSGTFREDLFYRLNVISITLPPLRDRKEDLPVLASHFLDRACREIKRPPLELTPSALVVLRNYDWPGNVRELQNIIERAAVLATGSEITEQDIALEHHRPALQPQGQSIQGMAIDDTLSLADAVAEFKRTKVRRALELARDNQSHAAVRLGITQPNLSRLLKSLGLR